MGPGIDEGQFFETRQGQHDRVFGDADVIGSGRVGDRDTKFPACIDIDMVEADTGLLDELE